MMRKKLLLTNLILTALFFNLSFCQKKVVDQATDIPQLTVMTYDSMLAEEGFGHWIKKEFEKECGCHLKFVASKDLSGLLGMLQTETRNKESKLDVVLGITNFQYQAALEKKLIKEGNVFARSPYSIIVNKTLVPNYQDINSWEKVSKELKDSLLVEDPRLSSVGIGWLRVIYEYQWINKASAESLQKRVFPSWSSAYGAFLEGIGKAVWSYKSSEAYHHCNKKDNEEVNYAALPLEYPEQIERVSVYKDSNNPLNDKFINFLLSEKVQTEIPLRNWMYPAESKTKLPECYKNVSTSVKAVDSQLKASWDLLNEWKDKWSL